MKLLTSVAALFVFTLSTAAIAQPANPPQLQPVIVDVVYHHFPTAELKAELLRNLDFVFKKHGCQNAANEPFKAYERPMNVTNFSLGLTGIISCKEPACAKSNTPSQILLTFYDDGVPNRTSIAQFEFVSCGSQYRTMHRFAGSKQIGYWADSAPHSDSYRWQHDPRVTTMRLFTGNGTTVRNLELKK